MMEKILINSLAGNIVNRVHGAIFCSIFNKRITLKSRSMKMILKEAKYKQPWD